MSLYSRSDAYSKSDFRAGVHKQQVRHLQQVTNKSKATIHCRSIILSRLDKYRSSCS